MGSDRMIRLTCRTVLGGDVIALGLVLSGCGGGGGGGGGEAAAEATVPAATIPGPQGGGDGAVQFTVSNTDPSNYEWDALATGEAAYVDRQFTFTNIPAEYQGLRFLRTANDDKYVSDSSAISFDVNAPVTVYVAYDARVSNLPGWLQSWASSGRQVETNDTVFDVYQKDFAAGLVSLGGNELGGSMYTVILSVEGTAGALTISGSPATSITAGTAYSFRPEISGGAGAVTFSITNQPSWASFDSDTGTLSGTAGTGEIGQISSGIVISASDDAESVSLQTFAISVVGSGSGAATLSWSAPTQNVDNTPLMDLAGYKIYYGTTVGNYPNSTPMIDAGLSTYMVENLSTGTWNFVVTALDTRGNESSYSNVASKTIFGQ